MNLKQISLTNFFKRKKTEKDGSSSDSGDESEYAPSKQKSMFTTPMLWTRVKEVSPNPSVRISSFDVEEDLKQDRFMKQIRKGAVRELGALLFDPDDFKDQTKQLTLSNFKLTTDELRDFAMMASTIRRNFVSIVKSRV